MIDDLDQALRKLLIRELPIKNGEVDIAFDQPKREWSTRINRPTLNLFIHDMHENAELRRSKQWQTVEMRDGTIVQRRPPIRMDISYMITAWAADPADEHRLLTRTLMALLRQPALPEDVLPESLQDQPVSIPIEVAQPEAMVNATDIWSVLDNEMKPAIGCTITLAINPYMPVTEPLVRTRELRTGQIAPPLFQQPDGQAGQERLWRIGGRIHTKQDEQSLASARLTLVERGLEVPIEPEGQFNIGQLRAGDYTLEIQVGEKKAKRHKITVPSTSYDIEI
jgi:hypothetical protein